MTKRKDIYSLDGQYVVCYICGKQIMPNEKISKDHENPVARFHDNSDKNKHITHFDCNCEKGMLTIEEYKIWKIFDMVRNGNKDPKYVKAVEKLTTLVRTIVNDNKRLEK